MVPSASGCEFLAPLMAFDYSNASYGLQSDEIHLTHPKTRENLTLSPSKNGKMRYFLNSKLISVVLNSEKMKFEPGTCECLGVWVNGTGSSIGAFGRDTLRVRCSEEICSSLGGEEYGECLNEFEENGNSWDWISRKAIQFKEEKVNSIQ